MHVMLRRLGPNSIETRPSAAEL